MAAAAAAAAEQLTSEVAAKDDFWAALDVMLVQSLGENDAARVRRAFAKVGVDSDASFCGMMDGSTGSQWLPRTTVCVFVRIKQSIDNLS